MIAVNFYIKGEVSLENRKILEQSDPDFLNKLLNKQIQIYLVLSLPGERIFIYTGKRIQQSFWDKEKQEANCRRMRQGGEDLNQWLRDLKSRVLKRCHELENQGIRPTKEDLVKILSEKKLSRIRKNDVQTLTMEFLEEHKSFLGTSLRPNTRKKYLTLINHLNGYCDFKGVAFSLDKVNTAFFKGFRDYLSKEVGQSDNTVVKYLKTAKTLFRHYVQKGMIRPISLAEIKTVEREGDVYFIPVKQILFLQDLEIKDSLMAKVRDVFCFMCWTGQRFCDVQSIRWEQIYLDEDGHKVWEVNTTKTDQRIVVPVIDHADRILRKYEGQPYPLPVPANQTMNNYLKELGKLAALNKSTQVIRYHDGMKKEHYVPFYKVLTTHVARKSFITNSLIHGVPERVVREVSGHKDEKSFRRYVKLSESYCNQQIRKAFDGIS